MQLFYNSEITKTSQHFTFDKTESRHIVRVLRKKEGDNIFITNGLGDVLLLKLKLQTTKGVWSKF